MIVIFASVDLHFLRLLEDVQRVFGTNPPICLVYKLKHIVMTASCVTRRFTVTLGPLQPFHIGLLNECSACVFHATKDCNISSSVLLSESPRHGRKWPWFTPNNPTQCTGVNTYIVCHCCSQLPAQRQCGCIVGMNAVVLKPLRLFVWMSEEGF